MNMSIPFERRLSLSLAVVFALFCFSCQSLIWDIGFTDFRIFYSEDSASYIHVSEHLMPDKIRTIGYPWLIHFIRWLSPETQNTNILLMQFALTISVYIIVLYVLFKFVPKRISLPIGFLFILNPTLVLLSQAVLTECLFCFLLTGSFYFYIRHYQTKNKTALLFSFLFICLATLVRPGLYYFCLGLFLIMLINFFRTRKWAAALAMLAIFACSIGFQVFKFYQKYELPKLSIIDDVTLWQYAGAKMKSLQNQSETLDEMKIQMQYRDSVLAQSSVKQQSLFYKQEIKDYIQREPVLFVRAYADNLLSNFHTGNLLYGNLNNHDNRSFFHFTRIFNMLNVSLLMIVSLVVLIYVIRKGEARYYAFILPLLLCNYLFFTAGISYWQGDRFNAVWFPILYICLGLLFKTNTIREKNTMFV